MSKSSTLRSRGLGLWMNGVHVGTWSYTQSGGDVLAYEDAWVKSPGGRPLSLSLPFLPGNAPHRGDRVRHYFDNLLPDNADILKRIASRYKLNDTETMHLLAEIGRDCVGALQLLPVGMVPTLAPIQAGPVLSESQIATILRNAVTLPAVARAHPDDEFRISIAGAQEKTALLQLDGNWHVPIGVTPTTHILKLPLGLIGGLRNIDMRGSVENEWLCSLILRAYGLPVAQCRPCTFEEITVLSVERFDRRLEPMKDVHTVIRLPQEDMCQASGLSPLSKYESDSTGEGGPGMDDILSLLDGAVDARADKTTFFQAQVIFWMLCATDGHAKNFSIFLHPGGAYSLTPLYDVLSASPLLGRRNNQLNPREVRMAMAVRSKNPHWKMSEIYPRHWMAVGGRHRLDASALLHDLVVKTPSVIQSVSQLLPANFPASIAEPVFAGLEKAALRLSQAGAA